VSSNKDLSDFANYICDLSALCGDKSYAFPDLIFISGLFSFIYTRII